MDVCLLNAPRSQHLLWQTCGVISVSLLCLLVSDDNLIFWLELSVRSTFFAILFLAQCGKVLFIVCVVHLSITQAVSLPNLICSTSPPPMSPLALASSAVKAIPGTISWKVKKSETSKFHRWNCWVLKHLVHHISPKHHMNRLATQGDFGKCHCPSQQ